MYADGEGVPKDDVTAHAWWSIAANGFAQVKGVKDLLAQTMTPDQIAAAEALAKEMVKRNPKLIQKKE
jgi:TPR repeat protein